MHETNNANRVRLQALKREVSTFSNERDQRSRDLRERERESALRLTDNANSVRLQAGRH